MTVIELATVHVRAATEADRETLLGLWDDWVAAERQPPWAPPEAREGTAHGIDDSIRAGAAFVAEREGRAVGFAAGLPRGSSAMELTELYVRPEERGRGVASALVAEVVRVARASSASYVFVATAPDGAAREIYERWGFRVHSVELVAAADAVAAALPGRP